MHFRSDNDRGFASMLSSRRMRSRSLFVVIAWPSIYSYYTWAGRSSRRLEEEGGRGVEIEHELGCDVNGVGANSISSGSVDNVEL